MNAPNPTAVRTSDLTIRRGGMVILADVSLEIGAGVFALLGDNGTGKSTLLRALAGIQPPATGTVHLDGHDLWHEPIAARRAMGYLPESPDLFPYLTARELLHTANGVRGLPPETGEAQFSRWVRPEALDLRIGSLSAGQRRKLALVAATAHEPRIVLLDEPANTLDEAATADLTQMLVEWRDAGRTVIAATHRPDALDGICDGRLRVADHTVVRS